MNNRLIGLLLFIPFVFVALWGIHYIHFVTNAQNVLLPIQGFDPRNFLSGHYIQYQINWSAADCHQADWDGICPKRAFPNVSRYYIPEHLVKPIEKALNTPITKPGQFPAAIVFAYQRGHKPIPKDLLINGNSVLK